MEEREVSQLAQLIISEIEHRCKNLDPEEYKALLKEIVDHCEMVIDGA